MWLFIYEVFFSVALSCSHFKLLFLFIPLYFGLSEGAGWLKELTSFCRPCFLLPLSSIFQDKTLKTFEYFLFLKLQLRKKPKKLFFPLCVWIFSHVFPDLVWSIWSTFLPFLNQAEPKKDLTKEFIICFYGNSAFPEPLRTKGLSFNVQQTQRLRYI